MADDATLIKGWLLEYDWQRDLTEEEKRAMVDCIMAQEGWRFVRQRLRFLRSQHVPEGEFRLTVKDVWIGLIEQHSAPHLTACPNHGPAGSKPATDRSEPEGM